jgi:hypothetical protein
VLEIKQEGVSGTGGEGSARWHLNRGEGKMGTAGPAQTHGKGRGRLVSVRGGGAWPGHRPRRDGCRQRAVREQGRGVDRHVGHVGGGSWAGCYGLGLVNSAFFELNQIVSKGLELIRYKDGLPLLNKFQINMVMKDLKK